MVAAGVAVGLFRRIGVTRMMMILRGFRRRRVRMSIAVSGMGVPTDHSRRVRGQTLQRQGDQQKGSKQCAQRIHRLKSKPIWSLHTICNATPGNTIGSRPDAEHADACVTFVTPKMVRWPDFGGAVSSIVEVSIGAPKNRWFFLSNFFV